MFGISQENLAIRRSLVLYDKIQFHVNENDFPGGLNLERNYNTWFEISTLHIWFILSRLRIDSQPKVAQHLFNRFWNDNLMNLPKFGLENSFFYNKFMDKQMGHYYGTIVAYDTGEEQSDSSLASAIWRNIFSSDGSAVALHSIVDYVRQSIAKLDKVVPETFSNGDFEFITPQFPYEHSKNV